jgi:hypothetical protein
MTAPTITHTLLWALLALLKTTFFGGWYLTRWLAWLLSPLWVTAAAIGAAAGFLADK